MNAFSFFFKLSAQGSCALYCVGELPKIPWQSIIFVPLTSLQLSDGSVLLQHLTEKHKDTIVWLLHKKMQVGEIWIFCASTIITIPTVVTFALLWCYHWKIPFSKRSTVTYLSLLLICSITFLITISVSFIFLSFINNNEF